MLQGLHRNERIIVGAYVDEFGGVCPMLAAHRSGVSQMLVKPYALDDTLSELLTKQMGI